MTKRLTDYLEKFPELRLLVEIRTEMYLEHTVHIFLQHVAFSILIGLILT